jgi:hypothetical protein
VQDEAQGIKEKIPPVLIMYALGENNEMQEDSIGSWRDRHLTV